ncbi:MAG TPA: TonB-dependent receptor [Sphingomicrobium sp.]|nr:TonB-dependent receptor [Sphingomicrobium sp.]
MTRKAFSIPFLLATAAAVVTPAQAQHAPPATGGDPSQTAPPQGSAPAAVQPALPADDEAADEDEIVIVGQRDPNAVIGDIPPENTLSSRDIRAYGASSIAELLDAVGAQTHSSRGRDMGPPVVLLNGKRISGFREIRDLPPEAILRMDILPEEVALKYGYRADQRVVNIVLRPRFRSTAARLDGEFPTEGGRVGETADVTRLMIGDNGRTTLNAHVEGSSALTESERDIAFDPTAGSADPRDFRTLIGSRRLGRVGGTVNRTLFGDVSSTLDGQIEASEGRSLLGPSVIAIGDPLRRDTDSLSARLGGALNGQKDKWRWSLTGAYDIARAVTRTDREDAALLTASRDRSRSLSQTAGADFVANGPFAELPAGPANLTVRLGADRRDLDGRTRRGTTVTASDLGRTRGSAALNVDLPVSRRNKDFAALGNLSLNANAEVENLSDFGTLTTVGGGIFWSPVNPLNLIASVTREEGAPSLQQLGDPVLVTPNARIFDYTTGQTVQVDATTGGNPALDADKRTVWKLGGTFKPSSKVDLDLRADYTRTRIDNPLARFPGPTAAIEAAFPERFTRDSGGRLVAVDFRPVNYDRSARDEFRWGFNFTKPLRTARPSQSTMQQLRDQFVRQGGTLPTRPAAGDRSPAPAADAPQHPPVGGGGGEVVAFEHGNEGGPRAWGGGMGRMRFGGGGGGGGAFGGRLQLSAYHTITLKDEVRIRPGLPTLDYLDGEASEGGGGRPRHRVDVDAGYFNNGLGARLSLNWQSGTRVDGGTSGTLEFDPLAKVSLNLFANLGERLDLIVRRPWLRGTQVRLSVDNIFDEKQRVRNAAGLTPVNYQPDLLDPQGRTVRISLRKLFLPRPQFIQRTRPRDGG